MIRTFTCPLIPIGDPWIATYSSSPAPEGSGRRSRAARAPDATSCSPTSTRTRSRAAAAALEGLGHRVSTQRVDVSSRESVQALAEAAAELGNVTQVAHTAGVSPVQAPPAAVLAVDLLGTALVLEEFGRVIAAGGAGVVISSMAGHMFPPFAPEQEHALAHTPTDELLDLPFLDAEAMGQAAYGYAKRANHLRVQSASLTWGERGARVNAISPGIIITPLARTRCPAPAPRPTGR